MVANKDIYELKHKLTFQLSWKQDFSWVAFEDVGETPTMYYSCCKIESKMDMI